MHTFLTDRWYDLQVFDVAVDDETGMGSCRDRVDVVFLANERRSSGGEGPSHRGRPKACITLCFEPGWRTEDDGTLTLLNHLGVQLPIPDNFDWERQLANRRIVGQFNAPTPARRQSTPQRATTRFAPGARRSRTGCPGAGSGTRVAPYRALSQCEAPLGR